MKAKTGSAIMTFYSPTRNSANQTYSVATITLGTETTNATLTGYVHSTTLNDYETTFPAFKLLQLQTNSTLAWKPAYTLVGTYQDRWSGLQKIIEIGMIVDHKAYYIQYISDASSTEYLPTLQKMIGSMEIRSLNLSYIG